MNFFRLRRKGEAASRSCNFRCYSSVSSDGRRSAYGTSARNAHQLQVEYSAYRSVFDLVRRLSWRWSFLFVAKYSPVFRVCPSPILASWMNFGRSPSRFALICVCPFLDVPILFSGGVAAFAPPVDLFARLEAGLCLQGKLRSKWISEAVTRSGGGP